MSDATMRKKIDEMIINFMALNYPAVPVKIPGIRFKDKQTYLAYWILEGEGRQAEIAKKSTNRHVGVLQIDVLTLENRGFGDLDEISDAIAPIFSKQTKQLEDSAILRFRVASAKNINANNGYIRKMISIPYWRDEPKT